MGKRRNFTESFLYQFISVNVCKRITENFENLQEEKVILQRLIQKLFYNLLRTENFRFFYGEWIQII